MPRHSKVSCPHCGGDLSHYFDGGEVPDADLGAKKDADLPDSQLPVYRGEAAKVRVRTERERQDEERDPKRDAEFAAAIRRRRRA